MTEDDFQAIGVGADLVHAVVHALDHSIAQDRPAMHATFVKISGPGQPDRLSQMFATEDPLRTLLRGFWLGVMSQGPRKRDREVASLMAFLLHEEMFGRMESGAWQELKLRLETEDPDV